MLETLETSHKSYFCLFEPLKQMTIWKDYEQYIINISQMINFSWEKYVRRVYGKRQSYQGWI